MDHWMDRFDVVVVGPGLGRDEHVHDTVMQVRFCVKTLCLIVFRVYGSIEANDFCSSGDELQFLERQKRQLLSAFVLKLWGLVRLFRMFGD